MFAPRTSATAQKPSAWVSGGFCPGSRPARPRARSARSCSSRCWRSPRYSPRACPVNDKALVPATTLEARVRRGQIRRAHHRAVVLGFVVVVLRARPELPDEDTVDGDRRAGLDEGDDAVAEDDLPASPA